MNVSTPNTLEEVIRHSGEGWILDSFAPPERGMPRLLTLLDQMNAAMRQRFGSDKPLITEQALVKEYRRSAHKIHAFIQALGQTQSADMLAMVWRILQGMEIREIQLNYSKGESFQLEVTLVSPFGEADQPPYRSVDIDDAALLRHIGIMKMGQKPVFDGFYPVPWAL